MKYFVLTFLSLFLYSHLGYSQSVCEDSFTSNYDEFDKVLDANALFTVYYDDPINFLSVKWSGSRKEDTRGKEYWSEIGRYSSAFKNSNQIITFGISARWRIKDCDDPSCWVLNWTRENDSRIKDFTQFKPYMRKEIDDLPGYGYVQFLSTSGETLKIYIPAGTIGTGIELNDPELPRSVDNYIWLKENEIDKIRFHDAKKNYNLDIDIPTKHSPFIQYVIWCIEEYKTSNLKE